ncbi:MAG: FAD-dependent thymidylate synthase [Patescibacteria group bacterium]
MKNKTDHSNLDHVKRKIPGNGQVLLLDTGAVIKPESEAMLQALHSRSVGGVREHLEALEEKGSDKFMSTFYVGYGHRSIGDCGSATLFIEGISMLAVKAIQDWSLYSGQESSTRYIDFANQKFIDPVGTENSKEILESWRSFYLKGVKEMVSVLRSRYPIQDGEKESVYEKAINARAFDIMRGFLPSGASTNMAWHSNLRQIADKLNELRHHPLEEVRNTAFSIEKAVNKAFPNSFSTEKHSKTEEYIENCMKRYYYKDAKCPDFEVSADNIRKERLKEYKKEINLRPPKTELPKRISECGTMEFRFKIDFGSFRDIQRHRAVTQRMPLVTDSYGFGSWYLEELSPELRKEAKRLIKEQKKKTGQLKVQPEIRQYYIPMGYNVSCRLNGDIHALTYLVELRSTRFVHPTLRKVAIKMADELKERHGIKLHLDKDPNRFDVKRGEHDITKK